MSAQMKKGLGKGLNAFFESEAKVNQDEKINKNAVSEIDINLIITNKEQPRKNFDAQLIEELSNSIIEYGIIQPLIVKKVGEFYQIIAGERRYRAARLAKLSTVPVIVREFDEVDTYVISLIENIQRADLNPIEEAMCYKKLLEDFSLTQEQLAKQLGKSRGSIANFVRLLNLNARVQTFLAENKISMGHAKVLLSVENSQMQFDLAEEIIEEQLSVRELEDLIKKMNNPIVNNYVDKFSKHADIVDLEKKLFTILGTKVHINHKNDKGKIEINYYSLEDLDRISMLMNSIE